MTEKYERLIFTTGFRQADGVRSTLGKRGKGSQAPAGGMTGDG
jgi:hypothetical protein